MFNGYTHKRKRVKVLLIEGNAEMEMGIPPNVAILVSALKTGGFEVNVFSTSEYKHSATTGDEVRVNTLQVPPTAQSEISIKPKSTDMIADFQMEVNSFKPDIIGFSTTEPTYLKGADLLRSIEDKNIFTIAGGAYPSLCPEDVIKDDFIDAVCIGEGEGPLLDLCQTMQAGKMDNNIKNIWYKVGSEIIKNGMRPLSNIDDTPLQDWSPWQIPPRASKAMVGEIRTTALVELSRGCPFQCSFCANQYLNQNFKGNYRERSVDRFIEEVEHLRSKNNLGFIYVGDETILTTPEKRFLEFIDKYSKVKLPFWCQTRPETIKYNKVKLLKDIGLKAINIGIESGNYEFRKKVLNRQSSDDSIINGIREAVKASVRVGANVIIGFPEETRDNIFETIELVREAGPTSTMIHLFQPYKKTVLRKKCVEMGLIKEDHMCDDYRMTAIGTGILSATELLGLQRTFNLYVDLPRDRWDEIAEAEQFDAKGNATFAKLAREYQKKHFGRVSF